MARNRKKASSEPAVLRASGAPLVLDYPPELPISSRAQDILEAVAKHPVVIVAGATGSGKTTQLPKIALELFARNQALAGATADAASGAGSAGNGRKKQVGVTQPRRIAATSVAARVASEVGAELGEEVGYQIRFDDRSGPKTELKFMTDGILLAAVQGDPLFKRYHTLIIDEAHERSLTIDFLLGWIKQILPKRPDLRVIISSATIETARFSEFFDGAPVIEVEGRTFPVDVLYEPPDPEIDPREAVADAVENIASLDPEGDMLVFLPGEREISETERVLQGRRLFHTDILPLYGRLSAAEQSKVFDTSVRRRVILATNVAETSLTLPGIVYVIDAGVARLSRYDPRTGTTRLQIEPISQASANQRKGRSGRVRDGICVRLYDEEDFERRPAFTDPEVRRVGLAGVILRMKSARLGDVESFAFLDPPQPRAVSEGYRVLEELGAIDADRELLPLGRSLSRFPVDPRIARMILAAAENGCLDEVLVLAAALEIRDPRERPRGLEKKAEQCHQRFRDAGSDFASLLKLWNYLEQAKDKGSSHLRRTCQQNFISHARVREWREVHRQLRSSVKELKLKASAPRKGLEANQAVHCSLLAGLLSRIGMYDRQKRSYQGARQTRFSVHPSSNLSKNPPQWLMAFELVETTRLFARMAAQIEPEWLDQVGGHLMRRSYSEPHWSEKSARASVREHATLYGLPVLKDRSIDYATVAPGRARLMFLDHALVRGEYQSRGDFQEKNRELLGTLGRLRDKARKSDMLADEDALLTFFDRRVPKSVVNGKTFERFRGSAEKQNPGLLELSLSDVLSEDEAIRPEDYPDEITLCGASLDLSYRFEPRDDDDGVTLKLPLALVPRISPPVLDWTIPAWHERRILELLERLPKAQRRKLPNITEVAAAVAPRLRPFSGPFVSQLVAAVEDVTGARIDPDGIRTDLLPGYFRLSCLIVDERGKRLEQSRELGPLLEKYGAKARVAITSQKPQRAAQKYKEWSFGELPQVETREVLGVRVDTYPALIDRGDWAELSFENSAEEAFDASVKGVHLLLSLGLEKPLAQIRKRAPSPFARQAGMPASPSERARFQLDVTARVVAEAFPIVSPEALPRTRAAFDELCRQGAARLAPAADLVFQALQVAGAELPETLRALDAAARGRAGAAAIAEMRAQVNLLYSPELVRFDALPRLHHFPRYLKAVRIRLERAVNDPRKDANKLETFESVWKAFLVKREQAREPQAARDLQLLFEELRVAVFAPELKPAVAVKLAVLAQAVESLRIE